MDTMIDETFLDYASSVLAQTEGGLTGSKIAGFFLKYAIKYKVNIPYSSYPFPKTCPNKRTAFKENLSRFSPKQQFSIIDELCDLELFKHSTDAYQLKTELRGQYGYLTADQQSAYEKVAESATQEDIQDFSRRQPGVQRWNPYNRFKAWWHNQNYDKNVKPAIIGLFGAIFVGLCAIIAAFIQRQPNDSSLVPAHEYTSESTTKVENSGVMSFGQSGDINIDPVYVQKDYIDEKGLACSFHVEVMNNLNKLKKMRDEFGQDGLNCQKYNFIFDDYNNFRQIFNDHGLIVQVKNFYTFLQDICSFEKRRYP